MIKHLTTVTEYHGAFALDFNFIVAKAAKYNQALLFHILVCCKDMVITFASINHKLVVGAVLITIDIDRIDALAAIHHGKGLEAVFAIDGLADIDRIFACTQVDFAVFHVTEGNVLFEIISFISMNSIRMIKTY